MAPTVTAPTLLAVLIASFLSCGTYAIQTPLRTICISSSPSSISFHQLYRHCCREDTSKRNKSSSQLQAKPSNNSHKISQNIHSKSITSTGFSTAKNKSSPSKIRTFSSHTSGIGTKALASAALNFDRLRKLHGKAATTDVYVRSPLKDETLFWFVGKVVRHVPPTSNVSNDIGEADVNWRGTVYPSRQEAVLSQKRLILEYAKNQLRPQEMAGPYSSTLELWMAPGDSEMDVVQNKVTLEMVCGSLQDLREGFNVKDVGYNPEIYVGEEKIKGGLRVVRDGQGRPVKPIFEVGGL